ncbi:hypothetical protein MAR_016787 [Mya arenaria]|uniref:Uncharacterized protein n=1 Tax=Mya arenaria TaxID=6604 RepID=A0ABY7EEI8_MYAAR|nr:hypothetical protein MAR_016787 [Mya arenaria]
MLLGAQGHAIFIACIVCVTICFAGKSQKNHEAIINSPRELAPTVSSVSGDCKCTVHRSGKENTNALVKLIARGQGFFYGIDPIGEDDGRFRFSIKSHNLSVTFRTTEASSDSYLRVEGLDGAQFIVECTQHFENQEGVSENKDPIERNDDFCCFFVLYIAVGVAVVVIIVVVIVLVRTRKRKKSTSRKHGRTLNTNEARNTNETVDPYWDEAGNALSETDTVHLRVGETSNNDGEKQLIRNEKHKHDDTDERRSGTSEEDPYWEEAENALYNIETMPLRVGPTKNNDGERQPNKNIRHKPVTTNDNDSALVGNAVCEEDPYWEEAENSLYNTNTVLEQTGFVPSTQHAHNLVIT